VIVSSEYGFRKLSPYLFELALRKAGLPPGDVWFCGDNPRADVEGAAQVGIFPVWYDNDTGREHRDSVLGPRPTCDHLYIREWDDLIRTLEELGQRET
jgi:putative hydrolase of the HAD superfamily